jgi:hypothetical protein
VTLSVAIRGEKMHKQTILVVNWRLLVVVFGELANQNDFFVHFLAMNCNGQVATYGCNGQVFFY